MFGPNFDQLDHLREKIKDTGFMDNKVFKMVGNIAGGRNPT